MAQKQLDRLSRQETDRSGVSVCGDAIDNREISKSKPKKQTQLSADAQIVADLFEDAADTTRWMQATLSRAQAAASQRDLSAELGGVRRRIDEIFLAIDEIERLAAPRPDTPRFWLRISGKKFYQSRSFFLSEDAANWLFRRAGRLETRDDAGARR